MTEKNIYAVLPRDKSIVQQYKQKNPNHASKYILEYMQSKNI